jgi:hypothetical protein
MDYTNSHNVKFKLYTQTHEWYLVKYYPKQSSWPRNLQRFHCPSDEAKREMFYVLSHCRPCDTCDKSLLTYRVEDAVTTCETCMLTKASQAPTDTIAECPVCLNKMLGVDKTKRKLVCNHEVCVTCTNRISKASSYYEPGVGICGAMEVKCPMCRDTQRYTVGGAFVSISSNRWT